LKNNGNVPSKSNKQKILKNYIFVDILKVKDENSRIRIQDPDPLVRGMDPRIRIHQNVMDPQPCPNEYKEKCSDFGLEMLEQRRKKQDMSLVYK
jgi:hypothetical protein